MTDLGHQGGSNEGAQVNSRYEASLDDTAAHIRRVREFKVPLFTAVYESIGMEDWTRVMSQELFLCPRTLK